MHHCPTIDITEDAYCPLIRIGIGAVTTLSCLVLVGVSLGKVFSGGIESDQQLNLAGSILLMGSLGAVAGITFIVHGARALSPGDVSCTLFRNHSEQSETSRLLPQGSQDLSANNV